MDVKTIVVLDDYEEILNVMKLVFDPNLYRIITCNSVKVFNSVIELESPDLILLDIKLPDGNGLDLCKALKDNSETIHIPSIMLSGYFGKESGSRCYPDAYIEKPFDLDVFKKTVNRILKRKRH